LSVDALIRQTIRRIPDKLQFYQIDCADTGDPLVIPLSRPLIRNLFHYQLHKHRFSITYTDAGGFHSASRERKREREREAETKEGDVALKFSKGNRF